MTELEKVGQIAIELLEHRKPIIKVTATNKNTGVTVFTVYGLVNHIDYFYIYFDRKYTLQNNRLVIDKCCDECYVKNTFDYDIIFLDNFKEQDYRNLLTMALLPEQMPIEIYNVLNNTCNFK